MIKKIKPIVVVLLIFVLTVFTNEVSAQKSNTIEFHTSAQCGMCKETIEGAMNYERGIQFVELNMENMFLTVKYKTKVHTESTIKNIVAKLGYSAGDVKANEKAMNELPKCCQPGAHL